jgi:dTDP-4-dehydrorhamnose 3,5-epimerase
MSAEIVKTPLEGLLIIKPKVFGDNRGYFYESWRLQDYKKFGVPVDFLQDNCSYSNKNVLRGFHIQASQGQILWPSHGRIYQVTIDVRPQSKTFGQHFGIELSHESPAQVYMPPGFAGAFCVLSDTVCMNYKCSQYYSPKDEGGIIWNDQDLGIKWPISNPVLSARDGAFPRFRDIDFTKFSGKTA